MGKNTAGPRVHFHTLRCFENQYTLKKAYTAHKECYKRDVMTKNDTRRDRNVNGLYKGLLTAVSEKQTAIGGNRQTKIGRYIHIWNDICDVIVYGP